MWIIYILLYLLGMAITAGIFGYFNEDIPGVVVGTLFWPVLLIVMIIIVPIIISYEIGQWISKYKNQIDFKSYFKERFCK